MDEGNNSARRPPPSAAAQFGAVLCKNLLQLRGRRRLLGLAGWPAQLLEIVLPALFFAVACLPKHYVRPIPSPTRLSPVHALDSPEWALEYDGPASTAPTARILYAPSGDPDVAALMLGVAREAACPPDGATRRAGGASFFRFFPLPAGAPPECAARPSFCREKEECFRPLLASLFVGFPSGAAAAAEALQRPGSVDAVIHWTGTGGKGGVFEYTLRLNHTQVPLTRVLFDALALTPGNQYKQQWFACNLQVLVDRAILSAAAATAGVRLLPILPSVKPFPWPAVTLDLGAAVAAVFFTLLMTFSFLAPMRAAVGAVVQERELLLREGLRMLGLRDGAYWASWALAHWAVMAASGALCALVGLYPFRHTSFALMLAFYWLLSAALVGFAYCLSTLFASTRVAGPMTALLYALAMLPGWLM